VPYVSLATSLNILITLILFSRLIDLRRRLPTNMSADVRAKYMSTEALVIESAIPAGVFSFIFVVLYGLQNTGVILVFPLLVQLMVSVSFNLSASIDIQIVM
jgi:hypothetical protein